MADVNGSTEETSVKETQELQTKVDVNGGGDNKDEQVTEEKSEPKVELDPEQRAKKIKRQIEVIYLK
ncbi:hypothetical protein J6590_071012 [Homalodisca vitripennis]|nr:hypothetical protein J6590_071012 [Homalodisca vitripennis]